MLDIIVHKWLQVPYKLHIRTKQRPKKSRGVVVFIHGIGNSGAAWNKVIEKLPSDITIVTVDLLGFGDSPRPNWARYDVATQARALMRTIMYYRLAGKVTIVGHSLGALVAIEAVKRYQFFAKSLILCSPPIYQHASDSILPSSDTILRELYKAALNNPAMFTRITAFATKHKLVNETFDVTLDNIDTYTATLEAAILDQTAYEDLRNITIPTTILRGTLDPFVIGKHLKKLSKENKQIEYRTTLSGHEVQGRFIGATVDAIQRSFDRTHAK